MCIRCNTYLIIDTATIGYNKFKEKIVYVLTVLITLSFNHKLSYMVSLLTLIIATLKVIQKIIYNWLTV